jgi:membrane-bound lytic murein transglycosylase F
VLLLLLLAADVGAAGQDPIAALELKRRADGGRYGDVAEIQRRGVLRMLTRNNSSNYFILRGEEWGFQLELCRAFAQELGVRLEVVVPPSRSSLIPALLEGEGDLVAAGTTVTATRAKEVRFSVPVEEIRRVVALHPLTVKPLDALADLPAFRIAVNFRSTAYQTALEAERQLGVPLFLRDVPPGPEMEELLRRVGRGELEATIADENLVTLEAGTGAEVVARLAVGDPLPKAWVFRRGSPELAKRADLFIERSKKNGLIRILLQKYFQPTARFARSAKDFELRADVEGRISPFDDLFRKAAQEVQLDWRLLAAVARTESRFDPLAASGFGAVGLMQLVPATARQVGKLRGSDAEVLAKLRDPEANVRMGAVYLRWLLQRFPPPEVAEADRIRLALAAYNVGLGHVRDAQALAAGLGQDPHRWFGQVEEALRLKAQPRWHERTRYGFCRAEEPIAYVRKVEDAWSLYQKHVAAR